MYVCTEKAAIQEWLKEIEQLKKDKELLSSDYKGLLKDKRELEKENKLLKARNEELNENCYGLAKENKELKEKLEEADKYVVLQKIRNGEF